MAGGKSSRMGSDKGLINYDGKFMVQYPIELCSLLFEKVIISTNNVDYQKFELPIITDNYKDLGPMGGLQAVLSQIDTEYAMIISCDMPCVTRGTIEKLISLLQGQQIVVPIVNGFYEPLCAIYAKNLLSEIEYRIEQHNLKMQGFISETEPKMVVNFNSDEFKNINTTDDLIG